MRKLKFLLVIAIVAIIFLCAVSCTLVGIKIHFIVDGNEYAAIDMNYQSLKIPEEPKKEGFTFDGWYWDNGTWNTPLTLESLVKVPISNKMCVYAKWTINESPSTPDIPNVDNDKDNHPEELPKEPTLPKVEDGDIIYFNGHKYQAFNVHMTWTEAKKYCESLGGYLATITSAEEQAALELFKGNYWLGATDVENEGVWKWVTDEIWSYENWLKGEPNNSGDEHYLVIWLDTWNDLCLNSGEQSGFICEWDETY